MECGLSEREGGWEGGKDGGEEEEKGGGGGEGEKGLA